MTEPLVSIIIIGRNEGKTLKACITSVQELWVPDHATVEITYVDSASTDNSVAIARDAGIHLIELVEDHLNAAKARNAGWREAKGKFVFFVDGDTIVDQNFLITALPEFVSPHVAVVCGQRREAHPESSLYNRALDIDWIGPVGIVLYCGGDAIIRRWLFSEVGGYDESLSAGEEPDLCRRLRGKGYQIVRLNVPMTLHELGINSLKQYWRRCYRTGYAYAQVSRRYAATYDPLWLSVSRYNILKGSCLLLLLLFSLLGIAAFHTLFPLFFFCALLFALSIKTALFVDAPTDDRLTLFAYGLHSHFQHIPLFFGQLGYWLHRRPSSYKST